LLFENLTRLPEASKVFGMKTKTSFRALYSFPGFRARARFKRGVMGDQVARVVKLERRQKKVSALLVAAWCMVSGAAVFTASVIWMPAALASTLSSNTGAFPARSAA
jgi:hypothetical protein